MAVKPEHREDGTVVLGYFQGTPMIIAEDEYRELIPAPFENGQSVTVTLPGKIVPAPPSAKGLVAVKVGNKTHYLSPSQVSV